MYSIVLQATSEDMTTATGNFDDQNEQEGLTAEKLWEVLYKFKNITPIADSPDKEICPCNLIVNGPQGQLTFEPNGDGTLFCNSAGGNVTVEEAYHYATGQLDKGEARKQATIESDGPAPVRMIEVSPTDEMDLDPSKIDTNTHKITHSVWKTKGKKDTRMVLIIVGCLFIFVGLILAFEDTTVPLTTYLFTFGLGAGLIYLKGPLYRMGHDELQLGFDWNYNIAWSKLGNQKITWNINANHIESLYIEKLINAPSDYNEEGAGADKVWLIKMKKNDTIDWIMVEIPDKKEAHEVFKKIDQLLNNFK